jgi:hypothetical protein
VLEAVLLVLLESEPDLEIVGGGGPEGEAIDCTPWE